MILALLTNLLFCREEADVENHRFVFVHRFMIDQHTIFLKGTWANDSLSVIQTPTTGKCTAFQPIMDFRTVSNRDGEKAMLPFSPQEAEDSGIVFADGKVYLWTPSCKRSQSNTCFVEINMNPSGVFLLPHLGLLMAGRVDIDGNSVVLTVEQLEGGDYRRSIDRNPQIDTIQVRAEVTMGIDVTLSDPFDNRLNGSPTTSIDLSSSSSSSSSSPFPSCILCILCILSIMLSSLSS